MASAWATRQRLVLGQEATADKSNEITAIRALLERLELKGALVTIDAMGTQTDIAEGMVAGGGDYLLSLKANWPVLHNDVETFFADPKAEGIEPLHQTTDADHGRIEQRRHFVSHNVEWLLSDRRYSHESRFPHLAMIAMVESKTERNGALATERRYYLSSAKLDAEVFAPGLRAHWGVENRLHWVLDVVFHDDLVRLRTGYGPQNMALVLHMNMNLLRAKTDRDSLKIRRKRANLSPDSLEHHPPKSRVNLKRFPCDPPDRGPQSQPGLRAGLFSPPNAKPAPKIGLPMAPTENQAQVFSRPGARA